ncbi:MAG: hypothetical protein U9Q67_00975 [Patescibacteria group bacterium]|nr:hypothetical protein [Patescibacteria group bacterium]
MKKYIVLDMHGVVFCHDPDCDIEKSSERFAEELKKYASNNKQYKDLDVECDSIKKGIKDSSYLQLYFIPHTIQSKNKLFSSKNKIIVVSNSRVETSKLIIKEFFSRYDLKYPLEKLDFYDFSQYGSKKESGAWYEIFRKYQRIDVIFEDKPIYLSAACEAAKKLGFSPQCSAFVDAKFL